jgi:hypothetical protein
MPARLVIETAERAGKTASGRVVIQAATLFKRTAVAAKLTEAARLPRKPSGWAPAGQSLSLHRADRRRFLNACFIDPQKHLSERSTVDFKQMLPSMLTALRDGHPKAVSTGSQPGKGQGATGRRLRS